MTGAGVPSTGRSDRGGEDEHREPPDSPVTGRATRRQAEPEEGIALCLSGGGYRAMLFHAGAFLRLDEAGWLGRLDRVSCVSGGTIAGALLALRWDRLGFGPDGRAAALRDEVVEPLHELAGVTLQTRAVLGSVLPFTSAAQLMARSYRRRLVAGATLGDLPARPVFVFNATNLATGTRVPFVGGPLAGGSGHGAANREISVADVIAASAAFPPMLSPARPRLLDKDALSDGGVYDNIGLDETWNHCRTVLISDGGQSLEPMRHVRTFWPTQLGRVLAVINAQVRGLRKRQAIGGFALGLRDGAYWGIRSNVEHYPVRDPLPCPVEATLDLSRVATRLAKVDPVTQRRLVNWGYAVTDAALRSHVDTSLPPPAGFPYPADGVG
jgi:NTE family protein